MSNNDGISLPPPNPFESESEDISQYQANDMNMYGLSMMTEEGEFVIAAGLDFCLGQDAESHRHEYVLLTEADARVLHHSLGTMLVEAQKQRAAQN